MAEDVLLAAQAEPLDLAALANVVSGIFPGATVTGVRPLVGGLGSVMHRVDIENGPVAALVHRGLMPEWGEDADTLANELLTHERLAANGLPAPIVRWSSADGAALQRPSLLMDFIEGMPLAAELHRPEAIQALAASMATLHRMPVSDFGHLRRFTTVEEHRDEFGAPYLTSSVVDADALIAAVTRLEGAPRGSTTVAHGDFHGGNLLWDGSHVTAVLDWTHASIASPWWDEGYAHMDLVLCHGSEVADAFRRSLRDVTTVALPGDDEQALWTGLALLRGLPSPRMWVDAMHATGVDAEADVVEARWVTLVEDYLKEHG